MIYIGSEALAQYLPERSIFDLDLISTYRDAVDYAKKQGKVTACYPIADGKKLFIKVGERIVEVELIWPGNTTEQLVELIKADPLTKRRGDDLIPSLDVLFMLKMSHRYLKNSPHFLKTMRDIKAMRELGARIRPEHQEFFKAREKATYTYKHPKLNVMKQDFFTGDGVKYLYDHDTIHLSVKHLDRPAYTYFKPDQNEVFCDRGMFEACDEQTRLYAVLEESYVLALERSQIPFPNMPRKQSFDMALEKVCTSITSGWFREFSWENYDKVQALYNDNYVDRLYQGVESGLVLPASGNKY
jgi:hypothetical protein